MHLQPEQHNLCARMLRIDALMHVVCKHAAFVYENEYEHLRLRISARTRAGLCVCMFACLHMYESIQENIYAGNNPQRNSN